MVGRTLAPKAQAVPLVATFTIPNDHRLCSSRRWKCVQAGNVTCDLPPTEPGGSATSVFVLAIPAKVGDTIEFNTFLDIGNQRVKGPRIVIEVQAPPAGDGTPATQATPETVVAATIEVGTRATSPEQTKPTEPPVTPPPSAPESTPETANAARDTGPPTGTTAATPEAPPPPPPLQQAPPTETSSGADRG